MYRRVIIILICVILVGFMTTCSDNPTESDDPIETIVSEFTIPINPDLIPIIEYAEDSIELPYSPWLPEINFAAILVCSPCEKAPSGFLKRVTGVTRGPTSTTLEIEDVALEETFDQADFTTGDTLRTTDIKTTTYLTDGIEFIEDTRDPTRWSYQMNKDVALFPNVNMHVEGPISFTQSFGFMLKIKFLCKLNKITFSTHTVESMDLDVTLTGDFETPGSITVWDTTLVNHKMNPITFYVYGVPVVFVPTISVGLNISAEGKATISTSISQSVDINASVNYRRGRKGPDWYASSDFTHTFDYTDPVVNFSTAVQVGAGPSMDVMLYGKAGPYVGLSGYLEFEADTQIVPWWVLSAGIKMTMGVKCKILGYGANWETDVFDYPEILTHAPETQCLPPLFDPPGNTFFAGQYIELSCATSGSEIRYTFGGSEPTIYSDLYEGPIWVEEDTEIKAKAFKPDSDWIESHISTEFYDIRLFEEDFIYVEGGNFEMGDHYNDGELDEKPVHEIWIDSFWIGKCEVTQSEYEALVGSNPAHDYGVSDEYHEYPVYYVSWYDAADYCNLRSIAHGFDRCYNSQTYECDFSADGFRLPTEAEWEYAARGGMYWADNYKYSGTTDNISDYVNFWQGGSHEVGTKLPNQLGLFDMSGNVFEWSNDWYSATYFQISPVNNPKGPDSGDFRSARGGGANATFSRTANRWGWVLPTSDSNNDLGFRLCRVKD